MLKKESVVAAVEKMTQEEFLEKYRAALEKTRAACARAEDDENDEEDAPPASCKIVQEYIEQGIRQGVEQAHEMCSTAIRTYLETKSITAVAEKSGLTVEKAKSFLSKCGLLPANQ